MIIIHFMSGKTQEATQPWEKFAPKLQHGGLRLLRASEYVLVPLNSPTIEYFEYIPEEVEDVPEHTEADPEVVQEVGDVKDKASVESVPEEKEEMTVQEKKDAALAEMKKLSECEHDEHDIWYQETLIGKKGSKNKPVAAKRYFPVCSTCGLRERYVKAADLSDEQKENAKLWDK